MALVTLCAWCIAGVMVALVLAKRERRASIVARVARAPVHVLLWPLFVPTLLPQQDSAPPQAVSAQYDERIGAAEATLGEALRALARDLEDPLALEWTRVAALGRAMRNAAARIHDIEAALALPFHDLASIREELQTAEAASDGMADVLRRRLQQVERLHAIRRQAHADLERALAEAAALSSRLTLLRYEDGGRGTAAAGRARELTETVEELCRVLAEARGA